MTPKAWQLLKQGVTHLAKNKVGRPATNPKTVLNHKFAQLAEIRGLIEEGKTNTEIAKETGLSLSVVSKRKQYLKDLAKADLTGTEVGEKRAELYLELDEISSYARDMYFALQPNMKNANGVRLYLALWQSIVESKMKLYGLDSVKFANLVQVNQNFNAPPPDTIDIQAGEKIARILKDTHEKQLQENFK